MYKKSLYSGIFLTSLCMCFQVFWDEGVNTCEYQDELNECVIANKNGSTRSIIDFTCLQSSSSDEILDQIILDLKFREIDDKIETFLSAIDADKLAVMITPNRVIDDISKTLTKEWVYYKEYKAVCNGWVLVERAKCNDVPIISVGKRIKNSNLETGCMALVDNKLDIYTQVAYDRLKLNKAQVLQDQYKKDIVQVMRTKFDDLITVMTDVIGFMWRLARGVTHWTPNPRQ